VISLSTAAPRAPGRHGTDLTISAKSPLLFGPIPHPIPAPKIPDPRPMLAMEDPSITRVIDTRDYANKRETAFSFYILWMCAHAYAMRQRRVHDDNEWASWLQWMRNCFQRGIISEIWKQIEPDGWLNLAFQKFVNTEIVPMK
jgi:hypothetical protein